MGALGSRARVGARTDSPPTPESKNRSGAEGVIGPLLGGRCASVQLCLPNPAMASDLILPLLVGYLLGSIPFGLLVARIGGKGDIRAIGSGNIGATNVLRTGSKGLAALTLLLDAAKGTVAVLLAAGWGEDVAMLAGLGAFLGHLFPVWLGFRGGKGVATYIGVLLGLYWPAAVAF